MTSRKDRFLAQRTPLIALILCMVTGVGCADYELVRKDELAKLREEAALGKSVGRYQQFSRSARTFRLDPATGETCILLTTVDTSTCTFQQTRLSSV